MEPVEEGKEERKVTFAVDTVKSFAGFGAMQVRRNLESPGAAMEMGFDDAFHSMDSPQLHGADRERQMSIAVADLVTCGSLMDVKLTKQIEEADVDKSGTLSLKELFAVFKSELRERSRAKLFKRYVIVLSIVCLILIAANAGATAAIVILTKETSTNPSTGELTVKGTDTPVVTGVLHTPLDTTNFTTITSDTSALEDLKRIGWTSGDATTSYSVCGTSVDWANETVTILTCSGVPLLFTNAGMQEDTSASPAGRRRLLVDPVVSSASVTALAVSTSISAAGAKKVAASAAASKPKRVVKPTFAAVPDGLFASGRVIVRKKAGANGRASALAAGAGGKYVAPEVQAVPAGASVKDTVAKLKAQDDVADAWPDRFLVPQGSALGGLRRLLHTPNDPDYSQQWALANIGAPAAWDTAADWVSRGLAPATTKVCVIDSGVDGTHIDLAGTLGEDFNAWDPASAPVDTSGHGTHIAGIIAANSNNGVEVAGVTWGSQVSLLSCKFIGPDGYGLTSKAIACMDWCISQGAKVISASWTGGTTDNPPLQDAISAAGAAGALFVVAAGNQGYDLSQTNSYPAIYSRTMPFVLTVAAHDDTNTIASFSNYDTSSVQLSAPGVDILSTVPGGEAAWSGTSMATPFASAAAAVLISLSGGRLTAQQTRDVLTKSAVPSAGLAGKCGSGGALRLDVALARLSASGLVAIGPAPATAPAAAGSPAPATTAPAAGAPGGSTTPPSSGGATPKPSPKPSPKPAAAAAYRTITTYVACKKGSSTNCKLRCTVGRVAGKAVRRCSWVRAVVKKVKLNRRLLATDLAW